MACAIGSSFVDHEEIAERDSHLTSRSVSHNCAMSKGIGRRQEPIQHVLMRAMCQWLAVRKQGSSVICCVNRLAVVSKACRGSGGRYCEARLLLPLDERGCASSSEE
jgi:hypothetical protein